MFGLFTDTKSYRLHFSGGSTMVIKGVKHLKIELDRETKKIEAYNITFVNKEANNLFHVSPGDIVAIEEL